MRQRTIAAACFLVLSLAATAAAQTKARPSQSEATVTYDVRLREFRCWREGSLTKEARHVAPSCSEAEGWHPVTGSLYFVRGEAVHILLVNAAAEDLFALELKTEDLAEPVVPIQGSLASVPKMLALAAAPTVVPANAVKFSAGNPSVEPTEIFRLLTATADKDFKNSVKSRFIDPLNAKEAGNLLASDLAAAVSRLAHVSAFRGEVQALQKTVEAIATPTTTRDLVDRALALKIAIDRGSALRVRLTASGVAAAGKTVMDAAVALQSPALEEAIAIDSDDYDRFTSQFEVAFPLEYRYARINAITIKGKEANATFDVDKDYTDRAGGLESLKKFLDRVPAAAPRSLNADVLNRLHTNLTTLAEMWSDVRMANKRADRLAVAKKDVDDHQNALLTLQADLNELAESMIRKAGDLNASARETPLDDELCVLRVGQWFSSKTVTVTLKQGQRVPLFDLTGVSASSSDNLGGDNASSSRAPVTAAADPAEVRTFQFPVYNLYRFKLGLGFLHSSARDDRFQVSTVTSGSGSSSTTQQFIDQTVARSYTLLTSVALIVYPTARHAFPWRPRYANEPKPAWYEDLGAMVGFSVTAPNKDIVLGGAWFPRLSPVGVQVGWHIALRDYPPAGFDLSQPIPGTTRVVMLQQKRVNGVAVGLVFTTDFFVNVFGSIFKQL